MWFPIVADECNLDKNVLNSEKYFSCIATTRFLILFVLHPIPFYRISSFSLYKTPILFPTKKLLEETPSGDRFPCLKVLNLILLLRLASLLGYNWY